MQNVFLLFSHSVVTFRKQPKCRAVNFRLVGDEMMIKYVTVTMARSSETLH